MCRDLPSVKAAEEIGADIEATCCKNGEFECLLYGLCGYQRQKASRPDVWFVPHEMLFSKKPKAIGEVAAVIVDEAAWQSGLEGVTGAGMCLPLEDIELLRRNLPTSTRRDDRERLGHVLTAVVAVLRAHGDGALERDLLEDLTRDVLVEGKALIWWAKIDLKILPGMPPPQRNAMVEAAATNKTVLRLHRLLKAMLAMLDQGGPRVSGHAELLLHNGARCVRLKGRRDLRRGWLAPTLHLDAHLDAELLRPFWPSVQVTGNIDAETPHMRVRQVIDKGAFGKNATVPKAEPAGTKAVNRRRARDIRAAVVAQHRRLGGRMLVVTYKKFIDDWRESGAAIPTKLEMANFNAVAGRDIWRDVRQIVVIGRPQPKPDDVERTAEALTGHAVLDKVMPGAWYDRIDAPVAGQLAEADCHRDKMAERVRHAITEGEVLQAIGRGRGMNRTADNPLDVIIFGALPTGLDAEPVFWDELAPSPADLMMAEVGIALESPSDAARSFPGLWRTVEAAKKAMQRARPEVGDISARDMHESW
jgi:putative DNA primase/helicase